MAIYILTDNGSIRAASLLNLERLAAEVSRRSGRQVHALPLQHSEKIAPEALGGRCPPVFDPQMRAWLEAGERAFVFLPFFIGPSLAITGLLKQRLRTYAEEFGELQVRVGPFLYNGASEPDTTLAEMLADNTRAVIREHGLRRPPVALVDHGTPIAAVNTVRDLIAGQLSVLLREDAGAVSPCSMERREGKRYAFNEPLLEKKLRQPGYNSGDVVLAMLFLNPGKHAGENGDVANIAREAAEAQPGLRCHQTPLLGEHPQMPDLLLRRLQQAEAQPVKRYPARPHLPRPKNSNSSPVVRG